MTSLVKAEVLLAAGPTALTQSADSSESSFLAHGSPSAARAEPFSHKPATKPQSL